MKIAQVSPLIESVPPRLYGGTERIVSYLTEELVRQGHEVRLFASGDSRTSAELVACSPAAHRLDPGVREPLPHHIVMLDRLRRRLDDFDIVHFHLDYLHFPLMREAASPMVTTQHGRLDLPDLRPVFAEFGDRDGDGFVEYGRASETGPVNQGWKDSGDCVFHADGADAVGDIAICEIQGYVYAAKRHAANIAACLGLPDRSKALAQAADRLRSRFEAAFWCEDIGTYALSLDGRKAPCRVRSSNAGQLLFAGIVSEERAQRVGDQLLSRESFSGWGIRTIASSEARYNPMSYHNGSVWPHDNALIGLGFCRYGLKPHLLRLFAGLFESTVHMDLRRLPELFCGFRRESGKGPTFYPVACAPQAWSSAVPFALLQGCLGLEPDAAAGLVRFREPRLPDFLDEVTIRSLALGDSRLDLLLRRYGAEVSVNVLRRIGDTQVVVTL